MLKANALESFLTGSKMRLVKSEQKRHTHFKVHLSNREVGLPNVICVSRSRGDIPRHVLRSIAEALGMKPEEFETMSKCFIGRECMLLALATRFLVFYHGDPVIYDSVLNAVGLILGELRTMEPHFWNPTEQTVVGRLEKLLTSIHSSMLSQKAKELVEQIIRFLIAGRNPPPSNAS